MQHWFVGVDAGGSNTRAAAWSEAGGPVRVGHAPGANWTVHGPALCRERIAEAIAAALPETAEVGSLALCMAGYYPPEHGETVSAWMGETWPEVPARLATTDVGGAWAGAHGGEAGLVLIAGTGSICYGRLPNGREARAGGWGPLYNDQGSGYVVGLACLLALANQVDGIGPETRLAGQVQARFPHPDRAKEDLRSWLRGIYRLRWDREQIARLSEVVVATAREGDAVARAILEEAGRDLADLALAVERALGAPNLALSFQGGFVTGTPELDVERHLRARGSTLRVTAPRYTPLEGALLLAADAAGGEAARSRVRESLRE